MDSPQNPTLCGRQTLEIYLQMCYSSFL